MRDYARLGNLDFENHIYREECSGINNQCSYANAHPSSSTNYVYPMSRDLKEPHTYLPWQVFDAVREATHGFDPAYAPKA